MAWVGYVERDKAKTFQPMASDGSDQGFLEEVRLGWSDIEFGPGLDGTAIRCGRAACIQDFTADLQGATFYFSLPKTVSIA